MPRQWNNQSNRISLNDFWFYLSVILWTTSLFNQDKEWRGHGMKIKLVKAVIHAAPTQLSLLTMTVDHKTGAHQTMKDIQCVLIKKQGKGLITRNVFLLSNTCYRENKNRFLFAYLESHLSWNLFDEIIVRLLPVGNTHEDHDEPFSTTSHRLHHNDTETLKALYREQDCSYNMQTTIAHMSHIINWYLWEKEMGDKPTNFTQYFFFRIRLSAMLHISHSRKAWCQVKIRSPQELQYLYSLNASNAFIKCTPILQISLLLRVKFWDGIESVNELLNFTEGRITDMDRAA